MGLRGRNDPLDCASSLDEPVGDSDTQTVADMVEDEQTAEDFHAALESVYNHQLHEALDRAMSGLDQPLRDVVTQRYYDGRTFEEIARDKGIKTERARTMQHNAFCKLRHPNNAKYLRPFRDEIISARAYRGTGMEAFRNSGMSSVERVAEYLDRLSPPA